MRVRARVRCDAGYTANAKGRAAVFDGKLAGHRRWNVSQSWTIESVVAGVLETTGTPRIGSSFVESAARQLARVSTCPPAFKCYYGWCEWRNK